MSRLFRKLKKSLRYGEKGFTLIELLIVIAILGILAAVAVPQLGKFVGSSKTSAAKAELGLVNTAMSAAMADAQVVSLPGTGGSALSVVLGSGTDFTITTAGPPNGATTYLLSSYIQGGNAVLKGTYTFDAAGLATQVTTGQ